MTDWIRLHGGPLDEAELPWPSVIGWKAGHAGAVISFRDADKQIDCRYRNSGQIYPEPDGVRVTRFDYDPEAT